MQGLVKKKSIGIVGSRIFDDYDMFKQYVNPRINSNDNILIVPDENEGVAKLAKRYANENGHTLTVCGEPNDSLSKRFELLTNMVDECIILCNKKALGTKKVVEICKAKNITYHVCVVDAPF